jgi:threonine/homoserine/homoserine lactone efflux protein
MMADLAQWLTVALVCALGAASPGPSLAVVIRATLRGGRMEGVWTGIGHGLGVGIYALVAVGGLSLVLLNTPGLQRVIELLGAAYLAWMGVNTLRLAGQRANEATPVGSPGKRGFIDGFMIAFLNPKIAVFFLALLGPLLPESAGITARSLVAAMAMMIDGGWYVFVALMLATTGLADKLRHHAVAMDRVMACVLFGVAAFLVLG